jgi:hypothetical protein
VKALTSSPKWKIDWYVRYKERQKVRTDTTSTNDLNATVVREETEAVKGIGKVKLGRRT